MGEDEKNTIGGIGKISEQALNGIVQSIEAAVVLHDRKLKVIFVNDAFEAIFDIKGRDAVGRSPMEFLPDFDRQHKEAILSRLRNTLATGERSKYHEFPYYSPSGKYRFLLAISIPIFDRMGAITHVMSVIHDITGRKELEQEAVKAARLSSLADMAYTLAHEINNPLTGIKLGLSTLYDSLQKKENIQVLDSVMKDLDRIKDIVHAFLKARKRPLHLTKEKLCVVKEIIEDVLFHLSAQLDLQGIGVSKALCNDDGYIFLDRDGVHQVLLNVFLNAIQATPEKGSIAINTQVSPLSADMGGDGRFLCISLTDTGVGIEKDERKEIFKPFYSSKPGGTGLGLSICKSIISSSRGFMELESDKDRGTTVKIYLPIAVE